MPEKRGPAAVPADVKPVLILDAFAPDAAEWAGSDALRGWATAHGLIVDDIYRLEVYVIDTLLARVYAYLPNAEGDLWCRLEHDHNGDDGCEVAVREPYDMVIEELPPVKRGS